MIFDKLMYPCSLPPVDVYNISIISVNSLVLSCSQTPITPTSAPVNPFPYFKHNVNAP